MAESIPMRSAILFLWQNSDTVVIGRHQNPYKECDLAAMRKDNIALARRPSGGGAVFHDDKNLNFSFIYDKRDYDPERNYGIIINALRALGISAEKSGRNDILTQGKKFSGNAFYRAGGASVHHGTIMIGVNMARLARYLNASALKLASKGVDSVSSRVINLSALMPGLSAWQVKESIKQAFLACHDQTEFLAPEVDFGRLTAIKSKIEDADYIMGKKYNFNRQAEFRFPEGEIAVTIDENNAIEIYSDFLEADIIALAKERLAGGLSLSGKGLPQRENEVLDKIEELIREAQK